MDYSRQSRVLTKLAENLTVGAALDVTAAAKEAVHKASEEAKQKVQEAKARAAQAGAHQKLVAAQTQMETVKKMHNVSGVAQPSAGVKTASLRDRLLKMAAYAPVMGAGVSGSGTNVWTAGKPGMPGGGVSLRPAPTPAPAGMSTPGAPPVGAMSSYTSPKPPTQMSQQSVSAPPAGPLYNPLGTTGLGQTGGLHMPPQDRAAIEAGQGALLAKKPVPDQVRHSRSIFDTPSQRPLSQYERDRGMLPGGGQLPTYQRPAPAQAQASAAGARVQQDPAARGLGLRPQEANIAGATGMWNARRPAPRANPEYANARANISQMYGNTADESSRRAAVMRFQQERGLKADGIVGRDTYAAYGAPQPAGRGRADVASGGPDDITHFAGGGRNAISTLNPTMRANPLELTAPPRAQVTEVIRGNPAVAGGLTADQRSGLPNVLAPNAGGGSLESFRQRARGSYSSLPRENY
jgi:hypothetical protein